MSSKVNKDFEKLPEIAERLKHVWWNEDTGQYCDAGKHPNTNGTFLNGALYAYQEQQQKIDAIQHYIDSKQIPCKEDMDHVLIDIMELLK